MGESTASALTLDFLHPDRELNAEEITRDGVAFITALEAQRDARFVLQTTCIPDLERPERGRLKVHLVVIDDATSERRAELLDDLQDVLAAPPLRWSFSPVFGQEELHRLLEPLEPAHLAEVARREEPCMPTDWNGGIGFGGQPGVRAGLRGLWSTWTLGPATNDLRRLASVLLAQEAPICIRVVLSPAELTAEERTTLEQLVVDLGPRIPDDGLQRASLRTLEALLYARPLFHVSCIVASPERLSRSLLSAIGHSASEPARHGLPQPVLQGGFAIIRRDGEECHAAHDLATSFIEMRHSTLESSAATPPLSRLRRLMGPWEAANVFRIPVADAEGLPGLETVDIPALDPPVNRMPADGTRIGSLVSHGRLPVFMDEEARFRHAYICGQTGTGKSTLLLNMAMHDIEAGHGVGVLDPHGDLVEALLERIPERRLEDVVLIDPADEAAVVGVNLLEAESEVQQEYLVEELARMFTALFDPHRQGIVGPRFETMLRQAANLLMAGDRPASMLDIATVFTDDAVRAHLTRNVTDPVLAEYWLGEMQLKRSSEWQEVISWFRSKFEIFRTSRLVRNVVGQAESTISFSDVLLDQRILLVSLSKGLLGEYNSALVGYIVFARLWSAALERASVRIDQRRPFHLYIDEFQNITNESLPAVLSEARKFRMSLTLANQFFTQIPEFTRDAIMGNVGSRVTFRLGPKDAELFSPWIGRGVHPDDLTTLPNHTAVGTLSDFGIPLPPFALRADGPPPSAGERRAEAARAASRSQWAKPVEGLDDAFFSRWRHIPGSIAAKAAAAREMTQQRHSEPGPDSSSFLDSWLAKRDPDAALRRQAATQPEEDT